MEKKFGTVEGTVKDKKGHPQIGATVQVDGTDIMAVTGVHGRYILGQAPAGEQSITVSMVIGKETKEVDVPADDKIEVNFVVDSFGY